MAALTKLFEPGRIGTMELKNRVTMAPMNPLYADPFGFVTERLINYFVARAKGGVSFIEAQACYITQEEHSSKSRLCVYDDKFIPGLRRLAQAVQEAGAKISLQIFHVGVERGALSRFYGGRPLEPVGPSTLPFHLHAGENDEPIRELTKRELQEIEDAFADAAGRVKEAGFDAVSVHGAHGYLISNFLSPQTNLRTDEYGGSVKKRTRFACEVLQRIRERVGPDFPIVFRMNGTDFVEGGITIEDAILQAPFIAQAGADAIHVSGGIREASQMQFLTYMQPFGAITHLAAAIKKVVNVPIITVGKINDPFFAEELLAEGKADFVALGRALIADPEWVNKARESRFDEINKCIYCNTGCVGNYVPRYGIGITCSINPAVGREAEFEAKLKPTSTPKRVMVIGGGPAGMEAAIIAAQRGHRVSLYEKSNCLGGQWRIAAQEEYKQPFGEVIQRMEAKLKGNGVRVMLNKEVTRQIVEKADSDVVVLATGARPASPNVYYVTKGENVVQAVDVIEGRAKVGNTVVVVGGRYTGAEMALSLAKQGKKVRLVTRRKLGRDVHQTIKRTLRDKLVEAGVQVYPDSPVVEIRDNGVKVAQDGDLMFIKADTVVLGVGVVPENKLVKELKHLDVKVYPIGDCAEPREILAAIREGAEVGLLL